MTDARGTRREPVDAPSRRRRALPLIAGLVTLGLVAGLGGLLALRGADVLSLDAEWMEEILEHRNPLWEAPSLLFNSLGGGWVAVFVIPLGVGVAFLLAKRPWAALYWILTCAASAGLVQLLKHLVGRARPEDMLVVSDFGSFPSGHTANAATIAVVLGLVLRHRWIWLAGALYTVAMLLSRTYLGAHWLTDTLGGLLLGAAAAVLLWTLFAGRLADEDARRTGIRRGVSGAVDGPAVHPDGGTR